MKKFTLFISVTLLSMGISYAQIVITQADMPDYGVVVSHGEDTMQTQPAYDYFQTGTNFNWTPGVPTEHNTHDFHFIDPSGTPYEAIFPTTNMVISIPGQSAYVLESNAGYLLMLGIVDSVTFSSVIVMPFIVPDTIMVFPLTYLTNYTSSSLLDETFFYDDFFGTLYVDSIRLRFDAETNSTVDGWGSFVHPEGSFDVIRELKQANRIESFWFYADLGLGSMWNPVEPDTINEIEIAYHAKFIGLPLFTVRAQEDSTIVSIQWVKNAGAGLFSTNTPLFSVFPNPSSDFVTIETIQGNAERIEIFNINGSMVYSSVFADKTEVVDVRNWPSGIYVLRWMTNNRRIAETKLIVQ